MKHTPGPWNVAPLTNGKYYGTEVIIGDSTLTVWIPGKSPVKPSEREIANGWDGDTYDHMETEECLANARLIAAAPDMLAGLQAIADPSVRTDEVFAQMAIDRFRAIASAAIANATRGNEDD